MGVPALCVFDKPQTLGVVDAIGLIRSNVKESISLFCRSLRTRGEMRPSMAVVLSSSLVMVILVWPLRKSIVFSV